MAIYQKYVEAPEMSKEFKLRPEQEEAIKMAKQRFFENHETRTKGIVFTEKRAGKQKFLWNAKMRFGKTVCALWLVKECNFQRTLILTHRPVVDDGWYKDFKDIVFKNDSSYTYAPKDAKLCPYEEALKKKGPHYIYFASMQDLRGSEEVGGKFSKNDDVFSTEWDLVIVDEAHEGTKTELGQAVLKGLLKTNTKLLQLSGTPFNLYEEFGPDEIYTWDYTREQEAKAEWKDENGPNPYATLPKLRILTYKMMHLVDPSNDGEGEFKFTDFFRVVTKKNDERRGLFVNEDNVVKFLDKMCTPDDSNYPFSTETYQTYFKHTLWVVPGVKEAKALQNLLKKHEVFKNFCVINVAGNDDDDELSDDALEKVKTAIKDKSNPYTITLSCGRLTTGVTVPEWTAVFYLKGSEHTKAATYLQTIFRVQSPHVVDNMMKSECYVFDFAPKRTLQMMAETAAFSRKIEKKGKKQISDQEDIDKMEELLKYMPVTSLKDGEMKELDYVATDLFGKLENVYADRVARHGFADPNLYNVGILDNLTPEHKDILLEVLKTLGGPTKVPGSPANPEDDIVINTQDGNEDNLTEEEKAALEKKRAEEEERKRKIKEANAKARKEEWDKLTPEEQELILADRAAKAEKRKRRKENEAILAGISIRVPLMMYGADVTDENEDISVDNFTDKIDDESWKEFMPKNVSKELFNKLRVFYNPTIFKDAGKKYRIKAREADFMTVEERIQEITEIFSWFKNPDKETVLTQWKTVNMHMSGSLGGYCFYDEEFSAPLKIVKKEEIWENGEVKVSKKTLEPRYVPQGTITDEVFGNPQTAKILEINSKSGLYPLYIAYTLYRKQFDQYTMHDLWDKKSVEETQLAWDDVIKDNLYVICNTEMAARITRRTLLGYRGKEDVEGCHKVDFTPNIKNIQLVVGATEDRESLINELKREGFWNNDSNNNKEMNFNAVVGNPPFMVDVSIHETTNGEKRKKSIFQYFQLMADQLGSYTSLIYPGGRWIHRSGKGMDEFGKDQINDCHLHKVIFYPDWTELFENTEIADGISVVVKHMNKAQFGFDYVYRKGTTQKVATISEKPEDKLLPLNPSNQIIIDFIKKKVTEKSYKYLCDSVKPQKFFGIESNFVEVNPDLVREYHPGDTFDSAKECKLFTNHVGGKAGRAKWYILKDKSQLDVDSIPSVSKWKVIVSSANAGGQKRDNQIEVIDNHSACGRSRVVLKVFDTQEEAENFKKYAQSKLIRFAFLLTDESLTSLAQLVPDIDNYKNDNGVIDFSKDDINADVYKHFEIEKDDQEYVNATIAEIDLARSKKKKS